MFILIFILNMLIQMFTSLNGLMIPGGPDSSIHPDAGVTCSVMYPLGILENELALEWLVLDLAFADKE